MWQWLGKSILRYRIQLILATIALTAVLGYQGSKVQLSYDFSRAIPTDHPKYLAYLDFKKTFGEDGNLLTIGFITDSYFSTEHFNATSAFIEEVKKVNGVEDIISVNGAVTLNRNDSTGKLDAIKIFPTQVQDQGELDSLKEQFYTLPFYKGLLYNPTSQAFLIGLRINKDILASKAREKTVGEIEVITNQYAKKTGFDIHLSGLPLIRTNVAMRIANELNWFLLGSIVLSALILFVFFRSLTTTLLSLGVVLVGVIYSLATIYLFGFKITLLTALIPPLIVVIGIPNCIYFLNKYHTSYIKYGNKEKAIVEMISKMGVVTLFCNISAALGFAVFALTKSLILKEFGIVAGINIMALFFISLVIIPIALYYMPAPKAKHMSYLENKWLTSLLTKIEKWVFAHQKTIYITTALALVVSIAGITKLKTQAFIVDDLPQKDKIYTDL